MASHNVPLTCSLKELAIQLYFEDMAPHDLFMLSLTSDSLEQSKTEAKISLTFAPNKTSVHVKTSNNAHSDFIVGKVEENGETFNCCFDREFFFHCQKIENGIVFPYGLDTVLNRLLRLYPRAAIEHISIALSSSTDYEPLFQVIQLLQLNELNAENVRFESENGMYQVEDFEAILKIFEIFESKIELPEVLMVENGYNFPSNFLDLPLKTVHVKKSPMGDDEFNELLRGWNSSERILLTHLTIETDEKPMDAYRLWMLRGLWQLGNPTNVRDSATRRFELLHTVQRHDGMKATVIRSANKFTFRTPV